MDQFKEMNAYLGETNTLEGIENFNHVGYNFIKEDVIFKKI